MRLALVLALCATVTARAAPGPQDPDALWARGERVAAVDALAARVALEPDDPALRRTLVEREMAIHRYAAALEHMGARSGFEPWRGLALYRLARYEEAAAALVRTDPLQALLCVDALEALGREGESGAALEQAARVVGAEHPRILCLRAQRAARAGDPAGAVAGFRAALDSDPYDAEALFGLGRALIATGARDEGLAVLEEHRRLTPLLDELDFARRGVDLAPLHAPNHARVGDVERSIGRTDRAESAYTRALALATRDQLGPVALRAARLTAEDLGRVDEAVTLLDEAAARAPDPRLSVRAGDLLAQLGRDAEALERYERAQEIRPTDRAIADRIATVRARLGEREDP